jgi:hypothetical protein
MGVPSVRPERADPRQSDYSARVSSVSRLPCGLLLETRTAIPSAGPILLTSSAEVRVASQISCAQERCR